MSPNKIDFHHLILTGFMGTGKTTVASLLAQKTGRPFLDTDAWISDQTDQSIDTIFTQHGEPFFRQWEYQAAEHLLTLPPSIIATGGGFFTNQKNLTLLSPNNLIITLSATPETIYTRLKKDQTRPLLTNNKKESIEKLLTDRQTVYKQFDTYPTDNQTATNVAESIYRSLFLCTNIEK